MKLINEQILLEDIAAVRKRFPNISDEDFNKILELDPTYREGSNSVGKYTKWLLNIYNKNKFEIRSHITDLLQQFEEKRNSLENKDIGQFKSINELETTLAETDMPELSRRQQLRKTQKAVSKAEVNKDAEKIFDNNTWEIWIPKTYEASCKLGQNTRWCTASTSNRYYYNYYTEKGNLYILINKQTGEKYQFHFETNSFMNASDYSINLGEFFKENNDLFDVFESKLAITNLNLSKIYEILGDRLFTPKYENLIYSRMGTTTLSYLKQWGKLEDKYVDFYIEHYYTGSYRSKREVLQTLVGLYSEEAVINRYKSLIDEFIGEITPNLNKGADDSLNVFDLHNALGDIIFYKQYKDILDKGIEAIDWHDASIYDIEDTFGDRIFNDYAYIFDNYITKGSGDLAAVSSVYKNNFVGSIHDHYILDAIKWQEDKTLKFEISASYFSTLLESRDLSHGFIESCMLGDAWEYFDSDYTDYHISDLYWSSLTERTQQMLTAIGLSEDDFNSYSPSEVVQKAMDIDEDLPDIISNAMRTAYQAGSEGAAIKAFQEALERVVPENCTFLYPYETHDSSHFIFTVNEDFVKNNLEAIWEELGCQSDDVTDSVETVLFTMISDEFSFYEPYGGWFEFNEDTFEDTLESGLQELNLLPNDNQ